MFGNFPYKNDDVYGGDIMDYKLEISTNLTFSIKMEILDLI